MRKRRSDKKINVNPKLTKDVHDKLFKLALACGMTKTKLAGEIISIMVNSPDFIHKMQEVYNKDEDFRITPIVINKEVRY